MKRITAWLLAGVLALCLTACDKEPASERDDSMVQSGNKTESLGEVVQQSIELVGSWHLDAQRNDLTAFADSIDLFPGYGEWGAGMEIGSDGQLSLRPSRKNRHKKASKNGMNRRISFIIEMLSKTPAFIPRFA